MAPQPGSEAAQIEHNASISSDENGDSHPCSENRDSDINEIVSLPRG